MNDQDRCARCGRRLDDLDERDIETVGCAGVPNPPYAAPEVFTLAARKGCWFAQSVVGGR